MSEELKNDFRFMQELHKEKTAHNRVNSAEILKRRGILFETRNNGVHLMIETAAGRINFWPGTGKYTGAANGRGVFNLFEAIRKIEKRSRHNE